MTGGRTHRTGTGRVPRASRRRIAPTLAGLALAGLWVAGCATLDGGGEDDVPVRTTPPGATVSASTGTICVSPCGVSGPRTQPISISISKPGYTTAYVSVASKPVPGTEGAASPLPSWDYLGRLVDAQNGANFEHVPGAVSVKLVPKP